MVNVNITATIAVGARDENNILVKTAPDRTFVLVASISFVPKDMDFHYGSTVLTQVGAPRVNLADGSVTVQLEEHVVNTAQKQTNIANLLLGQGWSEQ
jgi:hypothetical protein